MQNDSYLKEEHVCPHCSQKMSCCESPAIHVGDGLGWGSDVLFICLNDYCPLFLKGWDHVDSQYGHHASYRYMELPGSSESNVMMVGNKDAFKASVVDPEAIEKQNERYQAEKKAVKELETCVEDKNLEPVMALVLDDAANQENRQRALSCMLQLNDLACIDPIRNHTFKHTVIEQEANIIISQILGKHYKKECPYCSEIIKAQAKRCMHCQADI